MIQLPSGPLLRLLSNTNTGGHEFVWLIIPLLMLVLLFAYFLPLTNVQQTAGSNGPALCDSGGTTTNVFKYHFIIPSQRRAYYAATGKPADNSVVAVPAEGAAPCVQTSYQLFL